MGSRDISQKLLRCAKRCGLKGGDYGGIARGVWLFLKDTSTDDDDLAAAIRSFNPATFDFRRVRLSPQQSQFVTQLVSAATVRDDVTLPPPDEIARRIQECRKELKALSRLYRASVTAREALEAKAARPLMGAS